MGRARRLPMTKGGTALFKAYGRAGRGATKRSLCATAVQLKIILDSMIGTNEWGQSLIGLRTLIQRVTDPRWTVVDPFLGGGTSWLATMGRREMGRSLAWDVEEWSSVQPKGRARPSQNAQGSLTA